MTGPVTFVIFTFNEERRVEYVLRNLAPFGPILLIDNQSQDRTVEIASRFTSRIVRHKNPGYVETQAIMDIVSNEAPTPWVYWGYADEMLPLPLIRLMQKIVAADRYRVAEVRRIDLRAASEPFVLVDSWSPRLFRKGALDFSANHIGTMPIAVPRPEVVRLPARDDMSIHHFSNYTVKTFELAHTSYSDKEALVPARRHWPTVVRLLFNPLREFAIRSFTHRMRGGIARLVAAGLYASYVFSVEAKRWELRNGIDLSKNEESFDHAKEQMLLDIHSRS